MAEEGTLCINADVEKMAGANANSTADAEAYTNVYIKMIEGAVCVAARYDFVTNYALLTDIGKEFLRLVTSAGAALLVLKYDLSGFTTTGRVQTMIDICYDLYTSGLKDLEKESDKVTWMQT